MNINLPSPIYAVIPLKNGHWGVKAAIAGSPFAQYREFASKADADAWIERNRRELGPPPQIDDIAELDYNC